MIINNLQKTILFVFNMLQTSLYYMWKQGGLPCFWFLNIFCKVKTKTLPFELSLRSSSHKVKTKTKLLRVLTHKRVRKIFSFDAPRTAREDVQDSWQSFAANLVPDGTKLRTPARAVGVLCSLCHLIQPRPHANINDLPTICQIPEKRHTVGVLIPPARTRQR